MRSKKYIDLEEKFIRLQNIYKVTMKKYYNLLDERRHNIIIDNQKEKIKLLEKRIKEYEGSSNSR